VGVSTFSLTCLFYVFNLLKTSSFRAVKLKLFLKYLCSVYVALGLKLCTVFVIAVHGPNRLLFVQIC
jgi:hypothetical protein